MISERASPGGTASCSRGRSPWKCDPCETQAPDGATLTRWIVLFFQHAPTSEHLLMSPLSGFLVVDGSYTWHFVPGYTMPLLRSYPVLQLIVSDRPTIRYSPDRSGPISGVHFKEVFVTLSDGMNIARLAAKIDLSF